MRVGYASISKLDILTSLQWVAEHVLINKKDNNEKIT